MGCRDGRVEGLGELEGFRVGWELGCLEGWRLGRRVGRLVGCVVGFFFFDGSLVGFEVGELG